MRLYLSLYILLLQFVSYSQNLHETDVIESPSYRPLINKSIPLFRIELDDNRVALFNTDRSSNVEVNILTENLEIEKIFEVDLPSSQDILQGGYKKGDNIVLFITNHKSGKGSRYLLNLQSEKLSLIDQIYDWDEILATSKVWKKDALTVKDLSYKADNKYNRDLDLRGVLVSSQDKYFHFLVTDLYSGVHSKEKHQVVALDGQFNLLWQKTLELDFEDSSFKLDNLLVDDLTGNLFILGKELIDAEKKLSKIVAVKVSKENITLKSFNSEMHYREGALSSLHANELVIASFYGDAQVEGYGGVLLEILDHETFEVILSSDSAIPYYIKDELKDLIPSMYDIGYKVSEAKSEIQANEIFRDKEGSIYLIAEENRIKNIKNNRMFSNVFSQQQVGSFGYVNNSLGSILVIKINQNGSLEYINIIGKDQEGSKQDLFGVKSVLVDNELFLYANGTEINQYAKNPFKKLEYLEEDKTSLYQFIVDESGDFTYKKLIDSKKDNAYLYNIRHALKSVDNSLWITSQTTNRNKKILKVDH